MRAFAQVLLLWNAMMLRLLCARNLASWSVQMKGFSGLILAAML